MGGEPLKQCGQRVDRAPGAALVEELPELGEAAGFTDYEPAELEQSRLHDGAELPAGEVAQIVLEVAGDRVPKQRLPGHEHG